MLSNLVNLNLKPRLAQLFRVLDLTHEALVDGVPGTKRQVSVRILTAYPTQSYVLRDMYYKDVPLFKTQRVVDNASLSPERPDPALTPCSW